MKNMNTQAMIIAGVVVVLLAVGGGVLLSRIRGETTVPSDTPHPNATIELTNGDKIELELFPDIAPNTVSNFVTLIQQNFYDGVIFHRVIPGFVIQGGDPTGTGRGGAEYTIKGEFSQNGVKNDLKHTRGVISMARSSDMNSASSQFFIMHADADYLNGGYAAFGQVTSGMDVVDAIANNYTDASRKPLDLANCTIKTMTVDTHGLQYTVVKQDRNDP